MTTLALRRARPLLGTLVEIRVEGLGSADAGCAIDRAFGEIAAVHRLMSFHEAGSDLGRLHRARIGARVSVDARTHAVLSIALQVAEASQGCFDPTVAAQQVACGRLPRPASSWQADAQASWRDIEFTWSRGVRLRRPLWIDLGGIAKGYAVDRAVEILVDAGAAQVCVNAGGDLRIAGERAEVVHLRDSTGVTMAAAVELRDAALATSASGNEIAVTPRAVPIDGRTRSIFAPRIVSVAAPRCVIADALTKVVLTGDEALTRRVLGLFGAHACEMRAGHVAAIGAAA